MKEKMINPQPREKWCPRCKEYSIDSNADSKCHHCKVRLITVVYSLIDGRRITGENELGSASSRPTQ